MPPKRRARSPGSRKEDIQVHTEEIEFLKAANVELSDNLREVSAKLPCTEKLLEQSQFSLDAATIELAKARSDLEETKAEKEAMLSSRDESFREEMEKVKTDHEMEVQGLQRSFEQQLSTEKQSNTEDLDALRAQSMLSLETAKKAHEDLQHRYSSTEETLHATSAELNARMAELDGERAAHVQSKEHLSDIKQQHTSLSDERKTFESDLLRLQAVLEAKEGELRRMTERLDKMDASRKRQIKRAV
jgi:chromosome segregation ATPase